ncbi:hypothetical protein TNCV_2707501 [Trichonephila clavipes]|nr:hypothetical protein TNCV_2707501 [Trichonephila clavipes]
MNPSCPICFVQGSAECILVWVMFYWQGSGPLVFLEDKQTTMRYIEILEDQVHTAILCFYSAGDGYLMDGYATMQRARSVQNWFTEQPHILDVSSIENEWYWWKDKPAAHFPLPFYLQDLKICITNAGYSLDLHAFQKHIDSMPKRIRAAFVQMVVQ